MIKHQEKKWPSTVRIHTYLECLWIAQYYVCLGWVMNWSLLQASQTSSHRWTLPMHLLHQLPKQRGKHHSISKDIWSKLFMYIQADYAFCNYERMWQSISLIFLKFWNGIHPMNRDFLKIRPAVASSSWWPHPFQLVLFGLTEQVQVPAHCSLSS